MPDIEDTDDTLDTFDPFEETPVGPPTLALDGTPEAQAALFAAIASAQCEMKDPAKNSTGRIGKGGAETFKYADLQAVLEAVRPPLAKAGVAILQAFHGSRGGGVLSTILAGHGATLRADIQIPRFGPDEAKDLGAYLTYIKRYAIQSIVGVAGDTDLDETGQNGPRRQAPPPRGAAPRQEPPRTPPASKPQAAPKREPAPPARAKSEPPPREPEPDVPVGGADPNEEPPPETMDPENPPEAESEPEVPTEYLGPLTAGTQADIKRFVALLPDVVGDMKKAVQAIDTFSRKAIGKPALRFNATTKKHGWASELTEGDGQAILDAIPGARATLDAEARRA